MSADLIKKLRVPAAGRVLIMNSPEGYMDLLSPLPSGADVSTQPQGKYDFVQLFVTSVAELKELGLKALEAVKHEGLLWIAYPKKSSKIKTDLNRDAGWDVIASAGYEGVALISVDDTWSSMRFRLMELVESKGSRRQRLETGEKVVIDPTRSVEVPEDFQEALNSKPDAKAFFDELAYSHRKEYVRWITDAKREETRKNRIDKAVDMLGRGVKRHTEDKR